MYKGNVTKWSLAFALAAIAAAGFPSVSQAWSVRPNADEQIAVASSGATANPVVRTTIANPVLLPNPDEQVAPSSSSVPPMIVRVSSPDGGFAWGDAGVGAATSAVLLGAGLFGAVMSRRRRTQRPAVS